MTIPNAMSKKPGPKASGHLPASQVVVKARGGPSGHGDNGCCRCVVSLLIVLIFGFGCAALILYRQYGLDLNFHSYHDGDQVLAQRKASDLNTILCQAYTVTPGWGNRASVYLTRGPAKISPMSRETVVISNSGLRADDKFDYRAFYLLPGSVITVGACMSVFNRDPHVLAEVLLIKGDKHYGHWRGDATCRHCVQERVVVPPQALCEAMRGVLVHYRITEADTYYLIVTRQRRSQDDVELRADVEIKVTKTEYDTSNPKEKCLMAASCKLNLTYGADDDVIVEFPYSEFSFPGFVTYFSTECELRRCFWLTVFGVVPGAVICLLVLMCCVVGIRRDANERKRQMKKDATKLVFIVPGTEKKQPLSSQETTPPV